MKGKRRSDQRNSKTVSKDLVPEIVRNYSASYIQVANFQLILRDEGPGIFFILEPNARQFFRRIFRRFTIHRIIDTVVKYDIVITSS